MSRNSPIQTMKTGGKNLAIAIVAMFSVASVGLVGTTYATDNGGGNSSQNQSTSKEDCKNDGWKKHGFKNQGQCVKEAEHESNDDHGYGGNGGGNHNNISTWLNLHVTGDNNVVNVVINYLFG